MQLLLKTHIQAYDRTDPKTGKTVHVPAHEDKRTKQASHDPHADGFRYVIRESGKAVNAATVLPLVGQKFDDATRLTIRRNLEAIGLDVTSAGAGFRVTSKDWKTLTSDIESAIPKQQTKATKLSLKKVEESEDRAQQRRAKAESTVAESPATAWINATFGEEFTNVFNRGALANFLTGETKKFDGITSWKWGEGVKRAGSVSADGMGVDWAKLKTAYEASQATGSKARHSTDALSLLARRLVELDQEQPTKPGTHPDDWDRSKLTAMMATAYRHFDLDEFKHPLDELKARLAEYGFTGKSPIRDLMDRLGGRKNNLDDPLSVYDEHGHMAELTMGEFAQREKAIKRIVKESKASGALHLDQAPWGVEFLRGKRVRSLRDGSTGTIYTVDNRENAHVQWDDERSSNHNLGLDADNQEASKHSTHIYKKKWQGGIGKEDRHEFVVETKEALPHPGEQLSMFKRVKNVLWLIFSKAHVKTYQRTNSKTGQSVTVQEHEDKRTAARPYQKKTRYAHGDFPSEMSGAKPKPAPSSQQDTDDDDFDRPAQKNPKTERRKVNQNDDTELFEDADDDDDDDDDFDRPAQKNPQTEPKQRNKNDDMALFEGDDTLPDFKPIPHPEHEDQVPAWLEAVVNEPDIARAARANAEGTPTDRIYKRADGTYTPERTQLHEAIVASMLNPKAQAEAGAKPHALILMGCPGAGKTTTLAPMTAELGVEFTTINADDVKAKLDEYNGGLTAGLVHEESSDVAEGMLFNRGLDAKHNLLMDITGSNGDKVKKMVELFHAKGYEISIAYAHLPAWKAATRVVDRFRSAGRYVPPAYVVNKVDGNPENTYNEVKNDPRVSHWRKYNNDVKRNQAAPLLDSGRREAGHLTKAVHRRSFRADGRIPDGQDSRNTPEPLRRAYRLRANLTKSIIYLTDDLASTDLDPASRGLLLAERLHFTDQLTILASKLEACHG